MVSASTRRLPSTTIEPAVCATATPGPGTAAMMEPRIAPPTIRPATAIPPSNPTQTFMPKAPYFQVCRKCCSDPRNPRATCVLGFGDPANHRGPAVRLLASMRCRTATVSRRGQVEDVVVGGENHQHQHDGEADPEADFLGALGQG